MTNMFRATPAHVQPSSSVSGVRYRGTEGAPPLVAHVIHRLSVGGLENGLVNLINHMPAGRYSHAIICLAGYDDFSKRIQRSEALVYDLRKSEGHDVRAYMRLWSLLRRLKPAILHTRTQGTLDSQIYGLLAGVRLRVHGEHGQIRSDTAGVRFRGALVRQVTRPLVHRYMAVSGELEQWLIHTGVPRRKVICIPNGVDTTRFYPRGAAPRLSLGGSPLPSNALVIGTVGRMQPVKDQLTLARAFLRTLNVAPEARSRLRLMLVGDGPLRQEVLETLRAAQAADLVWAPGERSDIPDILRTFDLFVLPSRSEGMSNTILEAMASGLPVLATCVGGNPDLVTPETGTLTPAGDVDSMAEAIVAYMRTPGKLAAEGRNARALVLERYSMNTMVERYLSVYDELLNRQGRA
jgi:sugar transferase (PEP-CTERM/EpsH1 system associated)